MDKAVIRMFPEVLLVWDHQPLIGRQMFAIAGCRGTDSDDET